MSSVKDVMLLLLQVIECLLLYCPSFGSEYLGVVIVN